MPQKIQPTDETMDFAYKIRVMRGLLGMTQREFSLKSGVSLPTLNDIEHGRKSWLFVATIIKLANGLGKPAEQLIQLAREHNIEIR